VIGGLLLLALAAAPAGDPVAERFAGRRCLLFRYVASHRNASFGAKGDQRRPVSTIVEGPKVKYVASYLLELPRTLTLDQLFWYDSRLKDEAKLRGFRPGEVARVEEAKRKEDEVELKLQGAEAGDERKGRVVFKFPEGLPPIDRILEQVWRYLLPEPPYGSAAEEARAMATAMHRMPVSQLSAWVRRAPEDTVRSVGAVTLDLGGLRAEDATAARHCYEESYLWLSDEAGIALLDLTVAAAPGGRELRVSARPHMPLLGDWGAEGERGSAAFEWATAKIVRTLPRHYRGPAVAAYRIGLEYEFQGRDGPGADRLVSLVPASVATGYADLKIGARAAAAQSEHWLNDFPLSLGR